jgi:hypothetical protein
MNEKNINEIEFYFKVNERILGTSRSSTRPKSSTITTLQNRSILDIRAIQPPIQTAVIYSIQSMIVFFLN